MKAIENQKKNKAILFLQVLPSSLEKQKSEEIFIKWKKEERVEEEEENQWIQRWRRT